MKFCKQQQILNWMTVINERHVIKNKKKLHWTDSEFDKTYFLYKYNFKQYSLLDWRGRNDASARLQIHLQRNAIFTSAWPPEPKSVVVLVVRQYYITTWCRAVSLQQTDSFVRTTRRYLSLVNSLLKAERSCCSYERYQQLPTVALGWQHVHGGLPRRYNRKLLVENRDFQTPPAFDGAVQFRHTISVKKINNYC